MGHVQRVNDFLVKATRIPKYRIFLYITYSLVQKIHGIFRPKRINHSKRRALVVLSGYSLSRDSHRKWNSWHIHNLLKTLAQSPLEIEYVLNPFSSAPRGKYALRLVRIEGNFSIRDTLISTIHSIRSFGFVHTKESFFDMIVCAIWKNYLSRQRPEAIFAVFPSAALTQICRSMNIVLFEVQHGALPESLNNHSREYLRNQFRSIQLVWSEYEKLFFKRHGISSFVLGYPFSTQTSSSKHVDVLVALTYDHPEPFSSEGLFGEDMAKALTCLVSSNLRIAIRLHPMSVRRVSIGEFTRSRAYFKRYLKKAFGYKSFILLDSKQSDLAAALIDSMVFLTETGSGVLEAATHGVPTILIGDQKSPVLQQANLLRLGYIRQLIPDQIISQINELSRTSLSPLNLNSPINEKFLLNKILNLK